MLVDLLIVVLRKIKAHTPFARKLLDVVVSCIRYLEKRIKELDADFMKKFHNYMKERQTGLLRSLKDMLQVNWKSKEPTEIKFMLTVSNKISIGLSIMFS